MYSDNQHHDYNLQIVPSISAARAIGYQYTWTENTYSNREEQVAKTVRADDIPLAVTFHFQISGFMIKLQQQPMTIKGLMMRLWSIVGGVYVMCVYYNSLKQILNLSTICLA